MIVAFDGKRAAHNNTGLGNYSRLVIEALAGEHPDSRFLVLTPKASDNPRLKPLLRQSNISILTPDRAIGHMFPSWWRSVAGITGMAARLGAEIFHGLAGELPLDIASVPFASVVTIHDLIFNRFPAYYSAVDRRIYDYKYRAACRNATRVIAISECTRRDIMEMYDIDPAKIDVIYQGCDSSFYRPVDPAVKADIKRLYNLPDDYIISVGTLEPRKNQLLAVKALELLPHSVKLVLVGSGRDYADKLRRYVASHRLSDRVIFLSGLPFAHLPALYAMARLSSYTSRYEGFGIPVIESLAAGTPVIACPGSTLEEAGGPGAVYIHPDDVKAYADSALAMIDDTSMRQSMVSMGREYIKRFNRSDMASAIYLTYTKAINEHGKVR